ncbi:MAG TPA: helix-turn-helix domain-containing protein [Streptosporangiaceae bacterium]|jgi:DNA-binding HxlR family transcriptional regulator|nr:helix-turn-helix domain-containing protein [Streptosporangiaceae bacterium]
MSDVHPVCARYHAAIELIGARWSGAVLQALFTGSHRFADIRAAIPGVSDMMLTRRLRELEEAGMVERRVMPTSPVHVEYHLTQMGREARPVLDAVIAWSHTWIPLPAGTADDAASHPAVPATASAGGDSRPVEEGIR